MSEQTTTLNEAWMQGKIVAPWTPDQVDALNRWQATDWVHPFTCVGCTPCRVLHATARGWTCAFCGHEQAWAHDFMAKEPPPNPLTWLRNRSDSPDDQRGSHAD